MSHSQDTVKHTPANPTNQSWVINAALWKLKYWVQIFALYKITIRGGWLEVPQTSLCAITVFVLALLLAADWIGLGQAGASPCLGAPGGDSVDRQHSRHESWSTVSHFFFQLKINNIMTNPKIFVTVWFKPILPVKNKRHELSFFQWVGDCEHWLKYRVSQKNSIIKLVSYCVSIFVWLYICKLVGFSVCLCLYVCMFVCFFYVCT